MKNTGLVVICLICFGIQSSADQEAPEDSSNGGIELLELIDTITLGISYSEAQGKFAISTPKVEKLTDNFYGAIYKNGPSAVSGYFAFCSDKLAASAYQLHTKDKSSVDESFRAIKADADKIYAVTPDCQGDNFCIWTMEPRDYSFTLARSTDETTGESLLMYQRRKDSIVLESESCKNRIITEMFTAYEKLHPKQYLE